MLISIRMKMARTRHQEHFLRNLSAAAPNPDDAVMPQVQALLPPRKQWARPSKKDRRGLSSDQVYRKALEKTVYYYLRAGRLAEVEWGRNLLAFISGVQQVIDHPDQWTPPKLMPALIPKGEDHEFRLLSKTDDLQTRILWGLLGRYFQQTIEYQLSDHCYAFRRNGMSFQTAVEDLLNYRQQHAGEELYVAECDIRRFYDCVAHDVSRKAVLQLIEEEGEQCDRTAEIMLEKLFAVYNYPEFAETVLQEEQSKGRTLILGQWMSDRERKKLHGTAEYTNIGIPQGNAVSQVIANAVLSQADRAVEALDDGQLFYARYCDDIIIVHPDRKMCRLALNTYMKVVETARLLIHPPRSVRQYDREFYEGKSRLPFKWAEPKSRKTVVPWIQFLGYQVRYDGAVRVRRSSERKQMERQSKIAADVMRIIRRSDENELCYSNDEMVRRVALKMIHSSVGRGTDHGEAVVSEPCWRDAFCQITNDENTRSQMRRLDRHREGEIRRLKRNLNKLFPQTDAEDASKKGTKRYFGHPYSYYATLKDMRPVRPQHGNSSQHDGYGE